jgi:putative CocE/NonD family hydrolase
VTRANNRRAQCRILLHSAFCALALLGSAALAQEFDFRAPATTTDAGIPAAIRDLALRMLPVYQDQNAERYLTNTSALQLVAGNYSAAEATRQTLSDRRRAARRPVDWNLIYDIYARAKSIEGATGTPFARAYAQAYLDIVPHVSDLDAYAVTGWLAAPPAEFQQTLQKYLDRRRGKTSIPLPEALDLVWAYLAFDAYRNFGPLIGALNTADDRRRYVTDEDVAIKSTDGTELSAMLVLPGHAAEPVPAIVEFTLDGAARGDAREIAAHGYAGLVVWVRGRPAGPPTVPFQRDGEDGRAAVAWVTRQTWSDGRVAMMGGGYSAYVDWATAKRLPAALKAIVTWDAFAPGIDVPMVGNIFHNSALRLIDTLGAGSAPLRDEAAWRALDQAWYTSGKSYRELARMAGEHAPVFNRWLSHPSFDQYWQSLGPDRAEFAKIGIPVLSITGYYAANALGTLHYFNAHHHDDPRSNHTLLIGPYEDGAASRNPSPVLRGYRLDAGAPIDLRELRYQWFDSVLKGTPAPGALSDRVNYQVMGTNEWRHAPSLRAMANSTLRYHLEAGSGSSHRLAARRGSDGAFVKQSVNFADRSDAAWTPPTDLTSRALGSHYGVEYTSDPLTNPIDISGFVSGRLELRVNRMDFDLTLALYELTATGDYVALYDPPEQFRASYASNRSQRHLLRAGERQQIAFTSGRITSRRLAAGSRLVVVLGVNKRPDQQLNYGTGGDVSMESIEDAKPPVVIRYYSSSYLDMPIAR